MGAVIALVVFLRDNKVDSVTSHQLRHHRLELSSGPVPVSKTFPPRNDVPVWCPEHLFRYDGMMVRVKLLMQRSRRKDKNERKNQRKKALRNPQKQVVVV